MNDKLTTKQIADILNSTRDTGNKHVETFDEALRRAIKTLGISPNTRAKAEQRLQRAIAEKHNSALIPMKYAIARKKDVLSLELEMTLLPLDKPNANKQLIPSSEKDNIITSAHYKPIRANYNGNKVLGHASARDIGVITNVWNKDNVIYATGDIWLERNDDIEDYLMSKESHGGSFEIYYARSETRNGIEYLFDTVFAAHAIVDNPAYGNDTSIRVRS